MNVAAKLSALLRTYDETHNFTCDICGREVFSGERVCAVCRRSLPWVGEIYCPFCGRKVREPGTCLECKEKPLNVTLARSPLVHEGEASRLVVRFKRGQKYLVYALAELMLPVLLREFRGADLLVAVPMTEAAEKKRGYNQSYLLAQELGRLSGIEVALPAVKTRETPPQKELGRRGREENLGGSFRVRERKRVRGKKIVIVDDTMTTGATASEYARVLKGAGAARVDLLTATSVQKKNPFGKPPKGNKGNKVKV